ncbi:hypothetical protein CB1_000604001 [Camelus ferus]|nr:hypothetical protein CB1_000604001 [Camelus ferus]
MAYQTARTTALRLYQYQPVPASRLHVEPGAGWATTSISLYKEAPHHPRPCTWDTVCVLERAAPELTCPGLKARSSCPPGSHQRMLRKQMAQVLLLRAQTSAPIGGHVHLTSTHASVQEAGDGPWKCGGHLWSDVACTTPGAPSTVRLCVPMAGGRRSQLEGRVPGLQAQGRPLVSHWMPDKAKPEPPVEFQSPPACTMQPRTPRLPGALCSLISSSCALRSIRAAPGRCPRVPAGPASVSEALGTPGYGEARLDSLLQGHRTTSPSTRAPRALANNRLDPCLRRSDQCPQALDHGGAPPPDLCSFQLLGDRVAPAQHGPPGAPPPPCSSLHGDCKNVIFVL